jgi:hypothetical protein
VPLSGRAPVQRDRFTGVFLREFEPAMYLVITRGNGRVSMTSFRVTKSATMPP